MFYIYIYIYIYKQYPELILMKGKWLRKVKYNANSGELYYLDSLLYYLFMAY